MANTSNQRSVDSDKHCHDGCAQEIRVFRVLVNHGRIGNVARAFAGHVVE